MCEYCKMVLHAPWCPQLVYDAEPGRLSGIVTEDWARGVLSALEVDPTPDTVALVRDSYQAIHRYANAEGIAVARRHIPDHESPDNEDLHPLLKSLSEAVATAHADALSVGMEQPRGTVQATAPDIRKKV